MLVDLLLSGAQIENVAEAGHVPLLQRIHRAQKFELAPDFAASAEEVAGDLGMVAKALPHCRLPYPYTWVEVAQNHRPRFSTAAVHLPGMQSPPTRVGFLFEALDDTLATFNTYQFWELVDFPGWPHAAIVAMSFDAKRLVIDDAEGTVERAMTEFERRSPTLRDSLSKSPEWMAATPQVRKLLYNAVWPTYAPYVDPKLWEGEQKYVDTMMDIGIVDWAGEAVYCMGVLTLMNTVNATATEKVDRSKLNKARAKGGKRPLADHHVLKIHPRIKQHMVKGGSADGHRELRGNWCRGHWKVRASGIYFWRPHFRGDPQRMVHKEYRVE